MLTGSRPSRQALLAIATIAAGWLVGCSPAPVEIVAIAPSRNAQDVRSNMPIQITFDRPVDQPSVETRFHLQPAVAGRFTWNGTTMSFEHPSLRPSTRYRAVLDSGFRDRSGHQVPLLHYWDFVTESAPSITSISPGPGQARIDPASTLSIGFSRVMDLSSLASAVALEPYTPFALRRDGSDDRKIAVIPEALLEPDRTYTVQVSQQAQDLDGNRLASGFAGVFSTGHVQPLHPSLTFVAVPTGDTPGGVRMLDSTGAPREISSLPARDYHWASDGLSLLVETGDGSWTSQALDGGIAVEPFSASWAAPLATSGEFIYLSQGRLFRWTGGQSIPLAGNVGEAALNPAGDMVAYTSADSLEIWGLAVDLDSRFHLLTEASRISNLAWAPDGSALAYEVGSSRSVELKVRDLTAGGIRTAAIGPLGPEAWGQGSNQILVSAQVDTPSGSHGRIFAFDVDGGEQSLDPHLALPPGTPPLSDAHEARSSPDGHQIAFLASVAGLDQIWVMNSDGTGLSQLTAWDGTDFPYGCADLVWTSTPG